MAHLWPLCRLCKTLLVLSHKMVDFAWRCRKKRWQDGKKQGRNKCSKHLSCRKCYKKMLLTDYNLPWRQDIPSNKEILFLQESYHVWKDAIHALMKLSLPLISLVWPWFSAFWWSRGNRVRIMRWSNIFKIQWLYLYYSFNISLIYHSIDWQYLQDPFDTYFKIQCNTPSMLDMQSNIPLVYLYINTILSVMFLPLIFRILLIYLWCNS